jgi:hypothetical protein
MKALISCGVAVLSLVLVLGVNSAGEKDKKAEPKYTIKEVMMKAHDDDGILSKVQDGTATAKEKKDLVELYVALHDNAPPKGDKAKWAKVTQSLVDTAKAIDAGKDEPAAVKTLSKLVNCKNCHSEFKAAKKKAG